MVMRNRMNIKNAEAHAIAKELAQEAGVTMTQVVLEALRWRKQQLTGKLSERAE
jgi:hypothetical protein